MNWVKGPFTYLERLKMFPVFWHQTIFKTIAHSADSNYYAMPTSAKNCINESRKIAPCKDNVASHELNDAFFNVKAVDDPLFRCHGQNSILKSIKLYYKSLPVIKIRVHLKVTILSSRNHITLQLNSFEWMPTQIVKNELVNGFFGHYFFQF